MLKPAKHGILFLFLLIGLATPFHGDAEDYSILSPLKPERKSVHRRGVVVVPTMAKVALPREGQMTLELIKQGGPFPFAKDGTVFNNREMRLPAKPRGYYHEYTVPTPGRRGRGARRIIAGSNGEFYYTDDHYRKFRLIKE
jgi:ribonuclease T1